MEYRLITTFAVSEYQLKMLKEFCKDKVSCQYVVSVRAIFSDDLTLSLSVFANRPDIYFGVYSKKEDKIVSNITMDDKIFEQLLLELDVKFAFATTREKPVVNEKLALAWIKYINSGNIGNIYPL